MAEFLTRACDSLKLPLWTFLTPALFTCLTRLLLQYHKVQKNENKVMHRVTTVELKQPKNFKFITVEDYLQFVIVYIVSIPRIPSENKWKTDVLVCVNSS